MDLITPAILIVGLTVFSYVISRSIFNTKYRDDTIEICRQIFAGAAGGAIVATQVISLENTVIMFGLSFLFLAIIIFILTRFVRV